MKVSPDVFQVCFIRHILVVSNATQTIDKVGWQCMPLALCVVYKILKALKFILSASCGINQFDSSV